jgi:hypothetical protein
MILGGAYLIVLAYLKSNVLIGVIGSGPVAISLYAYITTFYNRIVFLNGTIMVTGNLGKKTERIQFKDEIKCADITDIKLVYANKNSQQTKVVSTNLGNLQPKLYFEITLKNNNAKWMLISTFSKRQRIDIINLINQCSGKSFNYNKLKKIDLSMYKKGK